MPYIFVHGLGQTPECWKTVVSALELPQSGICPDLPALVRNRTVCYADLYSSFCELCDGFSMPLHLCGLSLGGVLALQYAAEHSERVASLVLLGTQYQMPKRLLSVQNMVFRVMPKKIFGEMGFAKEDVMRLCKTMASIDLSSTLPRITCPVLVLCGEKDRANKKAASELAARLPNAELKIIPNAGHEVNTEAPAALVELLKPFFFA